MGVLLDDVDFDVLTGELRRGDKLGRLEPQPARVLGLLIQRRGEIVTRSELQERIWQGGTFVDFNRGLNYCIAHIRTALGDSASHPRFIETLPRRGYRLIAPIRDVAPEPEVSAIPPREPWWRRRVVTAGAIGLVGTAICAIAAILARGVLGKRPANSKRRRAAAEEKRPPGV